MKLNKESMLVYAITDRHWTGMQTLEQQVDDVLKNGATFLQIREKNMPHDELVKEAVHIKEIAAKYNVPVVIDDDIYAVMESGVDGVHIGQNDMDYVEARNLLGDNKIIGMTAPSVSLAKKQKNSVLIISVQVQSLAQTPKKIQNRLNLAHLKKYATAFPFLLLRSEVSTTLMSENLREPI